MSTGRTVVLGGGLAGLAAATALAEQGRAVTLIEAAPQAGGRCRSFFDRQLGCEIDNGNHLVLSGNADAMRYLRRTAAMDSVDVLAPRFAFRDLRDGRTWDVRLGKGRVPWRLLCPHHGIPGARLVDYGRSLGILRCGPDETVAGALTETGALYELFWKPFAVAVLNTEPEAASAALLAPVLRETLLAGGGACRPVMPRRGLGHSFVDPALAYLTAKGADVRLGARCRAVSCSDGRVRALDSDGEEIGIGPDDSVISALPPTVAVDLLPGIGAPDEFRAIVNVHFDLGAAADGPRIVGMVRGLAEWLFIRGHIASVTISAAEHTVDDAPERIADKVWREIAPVLGRAADEMPPVRVIKEKRATFAQTPAQIRRRPGPETDIANLWLAGDWTDTGLPATIEGAIRSGHRAAALVLKK